MTTSRHIAAYTLLILGVLAFIFSLAIPVFVPAKEVDNVIVARAIGEAQASTRGGRRQGVRGVCVRDFFVQSWGGEPFFQEKRFVFPEGHDLCSTPQGQAVEWIDSQNPKIFVSGFYFYKSVAIGIVCFIVALVIASFILPRE